MPPTLLLTSQGQPTLFLDMAVKDEPLGCIAFELFAKKVPKTAETFCILSTGIWL